MKSETSVLLLLSVIFSACNGDNVTTPPSATEVTTLNPIANNVLDSATTEDTSLELPMRWTLGPASYGEGAIAWQRSGAGRTVLFVSTPANDNRNGDYAGSTVTLLLSTTTFPDAYTAVDNISNSSANGVEGVVNIVVTAGLQNLPLASTQWTSTDGIVLVAYNSDTNQYHLSTPEPLTLTRTFIQGTGVPNAPQHISFEMQNLHGVDLCDDANNDDPADGRFC